MDESFYGGGEMGRGRAGGRDVVGGGMSVNNFLNGGDAAMNLICDTLEWRKAGLIPINFPLLHLPLPFSLPPVLTTTQ